MQTYGLHAQKTQKGVSIKSGKLPNIISSSPHIGSHSHYFTQSNLLSLQHYVIWPPHNIQALSLVRFSKTEAWMRERELHLDQYVQVTVKTYRRTWTVLDAHENDV
jgi:hypothetical protein